jgi:hypothetical protein
MRRPNVQPGSDMAAIFGLRMDDLAAQIGRLERSLGRANSGPVLEEQDDTPTLQNVQQCMASARAIYSSASTVAASTTGSELGSPIPALRTLHIENWISQGNEISLPQSIQDSPTQGDFSRDPDDPHLHTDMDSEATLALIHKVWALGIEKYEHGDLTTADESFNSAYNMAINRLDTLTRTRNVDFAELRLWLALSLPDGKSTPTLDLGWVNRVKLFKHHLTIGQREMALRQFGKARSNYAKALELGENLGIEGWNRAIDLKATKLLLALAYARERNVAKSAEARHTLAEVDKLGTVMTPASRPQLFEHAYLLASTHFYLDDLKIAQQVCEEGIKIAAEASEPGSDFYRGAMLMVTILAAMDECHQAEFWLERIPRKFLNGEMESLLSAHGRSWDDLGSNLNLLLRWAIKGEEITAVAYIFRTVVEKATPGALHLLEFLTFNAEVDKCDKSGVSIRESPLNTAARYGSLAFTSMLVWQGVDRNIGTTRKYRFHGIDHVEILSTPIQAAIVHHRDNIVEFLLRHGIDLEALGFYCCATLNRMQDVKALWIRWYRFVGLSPKKRIITIGSGENQKNLTAIEMAIHAKCDKKCMDALRSGPQRDIDIRLVNRQGILLPDLVRSDVKGENEKDTLSY